MNDHSFIIAPRMPRKRSVADEDLLDAALLVVREAGPDALSFGALAPRAGLAASTIVQRFGTKAALLRAALGRAWDLLDDDTARADATAGPGAAGVVDLLVQLSGQYDEHGDFPDGLRVLAEDLRDPVLRERGRAWIATLEVAIERRLAATPGGAAGLGVLVVAQWQGILTVWAFRRDEPLRTAVRRSLEQLLDRLPLAAPPVPATVPPPVPAPLPPTVPAQQTPAPAPEPPPPAPEAPPKDKPRKAKKGKKRRH
jgi:AcrR family transcriptional regulator